MRELLELLKDGRARSIEMFAAELHTTVEDIRRRIEYLERTGLIHRVSLNSSGCGGSCSGCDGKTCAGCMPKDGFQNMGEMWEVVTAEK